MEDIILKLEYQALQTCLLPPASLPVSCPHSQPVLHGPALLTASVKVFHSSSSSHTLCNTYIVLCLSVLTVIRHGLTSAHLYHCYAPGPNREPGYIMETQHMCDE